ncbi:MAG: DUF6263 family protein [Bacteroidota bacterium]|nr:DUF6263 family protein [Bacteroidota bacterium]
MKKNFLTGITFLLCISVMAQNSATLKLNLEKNKVYRLKSVSEQTISQTVNGNQQTVESSVDYTLSLKMIDLTPDFMIAEVHFDTLTTNTNTMGKTVSFSSTSEGNIKSSEMGDVMSCIMNRLSKNAVYVKMDFTGKPIEIVNANMLSDMILKDTSSIALTGPTAAAVKKQVANTVGPDNLKTMIGSFTWCLPGKQVSTGDNWNVTEQVNSGGMILDIKTAYHLNGINGNNANISAEATIKAAENAVPIQSGGATVTYDNLQGLSRSTLVIDIRTGLTAENKGETHISGTLGVSAPGFSMQMPMDIKGESKVRTIQ